MAFGGRQGRHCGAGGKLPWSRIAGGFPYLTQRIAHRERRRVGGLAQQCRGEFGIVGRAVLHQVLKLFVTAMILPSPPLRGRLSRHDHSAGLLIGFFPGAGIWSGNWQGPM
jgi:hypothetical protein